MDFGLLAAFVGGVLTLLSPCSVMLLPAFFSYAFSAPGLLVARTGVFYLGLITTLVPLGVLAGTLGVFVQQHRMTLVTVAAWVVIGLGAVMVVGVPVPGMTRTGTHDGGSPLAVYALGTVYGLAGVCAGPILGAVLTLTALVGSPLRGGITLMVFAAGMALPLLALALLWERVPAVRRLVRPRRLAIGRWQNTWVQVIGGILTIGTGILVLATRGTTEARGILGVTAQFRLESWVFSELGGVSDAVVVGALVLGLIALAAGVRLLRRRGSDRVDPEV